MLEQKKGLSPEKLQLLQRRLQGAAGKPVPDSVIPPRKRRDAGLPSDVVGLPLSFEEEGLWLVDQLEPNSALYSIPFGLRLKGALDVMVLQRCLSEILERHEALRTRFELEGGRPVQVVAPAAPLEMPLVDLSGMPGGERENEVQRLCKAEAQRPFDLKKDILFRARLFRLASTDHLLFLNVHHIVSDGRSVNLLVRELTILYEAFVDGKSSPLAPLPIQYADYAIWQRERLQGEAWEKQLGYWRKKLEGIPGLLELPADRPRPAVSSYRGAQVSRELPQALANGLNEFTRREGTTLFIMLLAAFQALLQRYTGQADMPVGTPIAGRNWKGMEDLVGFFVNTLVLRGDLSGDPSFRTLLNRTQEMALEAYAHQDVPFELLIKELQPKRNASYSPLFQVMLVFLELSPETTRCAGLEITTLILNSGTSKFDFTLSIRKRGDALQLVAEYNTDLFDARTIERMLGHYQKLLEGVISNPDEKISRLPLLTEEEKRLILVKWNQTEVDYPKDLCAHELVQKQAERMPEAIAAAFEDKTLTYRELNSRANQLARHLQALGVGPDSLVGICVERSLEMVIGVLAILKAGGAYVPLEPEYPKERLAFMVEDSGVAVLLTKAHLVATLPPCSARLIRLDADWPAIAEVSAAEVESAVTPENVAYMIYTSGSTGRPKGAMNTHRGIVNRLLWLQDVFPLTPSDRLLQKTPFSFDVSVGELLGPLIAGARLVVARPGGQRDPAYLAQMIAQEKITVMHFVPSLLQMLVQQEGLKDLGSSLKYVFCGGEIMSLKLQEQFFSVLEAELTNLYGPAEASVDSTYWRCKRNSSQTCVPIGRPIANMKAYVLDRQLQPVPVGVIGELHVSGAGLARGYHKRLELTAEKFIANPFSTDPGSRLYKTGDLARYLPDGSIEYVGRIDHQVKIRGYRVELGEVEEVLNQHAGVLNSAAVVREDNPGNKLLVAYLVSRNGPISSPELREFLRARLPDYMVPAAFVTVPALPLNPNGKVDRNALPRPEFEPADKSAPPATLPEIILARIWREVLGLKQVSVHDNFFESGGHSLLAVQLIGRINKSLNLNLPIPVFFQNPTIRGLAAALDWENHSKREPKLIQLQPGRSEGTLFLLDINIGLCRLAQNLEGVGPAIYGTVVPLSRKTFQAASRDQIDQLPSLKEWAAMHTDLIRSHQPSGPCYLAGYSFGGLLAFEVAHQLQREGRQVDTIFLLDSWAEVPAPPPGPPLWKRLQGLTPARLKASLEFRAGRLSAKLRSSRIMSKIGQFFPVPKSGGSSAGDLEKNDEPIDDTSEEIWGKIFIKARDSYRLLPLQSRAALLRAQNSAETMDRHPVQTNLGWDGLFKHGLRMVEIPGDHFSLLKDPQAITLARRFKECLGELSVPEGTPTSDIENPSMGSVRE
jgi:amino acid adenylation domain-containing protein